MKRCLPPLAAAILLSACASDGGGKGTKSASADAPAPYASTYKVYPGRPTALIGATVLDTAGHRYDRGVLLLRDGQVVAVGGPDLAIPDGYGRLDGTGKYVTPGVIDAHSHLGDYPSPGVGRFTSRWSAAPISAQC